MLEGHGEEAVCEGDSFRRITSRRTFRKRDAESQIAAIVEQMGF